LNIESLGMVNFRGKIAGSSFNVDKIKTNVEGTVDSLEFNKYKYTNITTNGLFQKGYFNGTLRIKDPNINFISNVELDLKNKIAKYNAVGDLLNANLKELNFSNNNIQLTGLLDVNFEGNTIDNFTGFAKFFNGKLKGTESSVNFDSLKLESTTLNGVKNIRFASDDFQANINGKFNIEHLPASVQYFMQRYYPTYISSPKISPENQQFIFELTTNYIEPYIRIFNKDLYGFNNLDIKGSINTNKQSIALTGKIPFAGFKNGFANYAIKDGNITGSGNIDSLSLNMIANGFNITDSLGFKNTTVQIKSSKDVSEFIVYAVSPSVIEQLALKGKIQTYQDGLSINWSPSYFILNHKKWDIQNNGILNLRESNTSASNFKITQGIQSFDITNTPKQKNGLQLELKNIILGDITKLLFSNPRLEGITNGKI